MKSIELTLAAFSFLALFFSLHQQLAEARKDANLRSAIFGLLLSILLVVSSTKLLPKTNYSIILSIVLVTLYFIIGLMNSKYIAKKQKSKYSHIYTIPVATSILLFFVNIFQNPTGGTITLIARAIPAFFLLIVTMSFYLNNFRWKTICQGFVNALLLFHGANFLVDDSWRSCDIFKCGPFGAIYTGVFLTENALAMYTGLSLIASIYCFSGFAKWIIILPFSVALYASESRSTQIACILALAFTGLIWLTNRSRMLSRRRRDVVLSMSLLIAVLLTAFYLLFNSTNDAFSNRGKTWNMGLSALGDDWISGLGIDRWVYFQSIGIVPPLFPHSQYLILLFGGGIMAVLLWVVFLLGAIYTCGDLRRRDRFYAVTCILLYLSIIGITEVFWNPIAIDAGTMVVIVVLSILIGANSRISDNCPVSRHVE